MSTTQENSTATVTASSWSTPGHSSTMPEATSATTASVLRRWWTGRLGYALALEVALMGALFVGYRQVRYLTKGDTATAMANASAVVRIEQDLGLFTERAVQRLVLHSETLIHVLNRYYVTVHFPATIVFILWAFVFHQSAYRAIRAAFLIVTGAALVIHVAFPLAPPRMLRAQGFIDTLRVYGPQIYSTDTSKSVANQFAAMPSLHFGWAVLVALGFMYIKRTKWSAVMLLHPAITLTAIVATANHYWLDAGVAMILVVIAVVLVTRFVTGERPVPTATAVAPFGPLAPAMACNGGTRIDSRMDARACERPRRPVDTRVPTRWPGGEEPAPYTGAAGPPPGGRSLTSH